MQRRMVSFDDCPDCQGTGQMGTWDCHLCHGTGQVRDDDDDVADAIVGAADDDVLAGRLDGLADGTHYLDASGQIRPKR